MIEVLLACYVAFSFTVPPDWAVTSVEHHPNAVLLHLKKPMKASEEIRVPAGCGGEEPTQEAPPPLKYWQLVPSGQWYRTIPEHAPNTNVR